MTAERFVVKDVGQEGVMVYDQEKDEVHFLNPVAFTIWNLRREKKMIDEMERAVRERFETASGDDVLADIKKCLKELEEKELI